MKRVCAVVDVSIRYSVVCRERRARLAKPSSTLHNFTHLLDAFYFSFHCVHRVNGVKSTRVDLLDRVMHPVPLTAVLRRAVAGEETGQDQGVSHPVSHSHQLHYRVPASLLTWSSALFLDCATPIIVSILYKVIRLCSSPTLVKQEQDLASQWLRLLRMLMCRHQSKPAPGQRAVLSKHNRRELKSGQDATLSHCRAITDKV